MLLAIRRWDFESIIFDATKSIVDVFLLIRVCDWFLMEVLIFICYLHGKLERCATMLILSIAIFLTVGKMLSSGLQSKEFKRKQSSAVFLLPCTQKVTASECYPCALDT